MQYVRALSAVAGEYVAQGFRVAGGLRADFTRLSPLRRAVAVFVTLDALLLAWVVLTPSPGRLIPVGQSVVGAYRLLESTPSGARLVSDVRRASRGDVIYLTAGRTEEDRLSDGWGYPARGVTRARTIWDGRRFHVRTVTVIVNDDVTWGDMTEIVRSLAFELENVLQVYRNPGAERGIDSPAAAMTQMRVAHELGMD